MLYILLFWIFVSLSVHFAANYAGAANESILLGFINTAVLFFVYYVLFVFLSTQAVKVSPSLVWAH